MSTATAPYQVVLDPQAYAGIHLVESDGEPMETILHRDCMLLLIAAATHYNRGRPDFLVGGDNFIYFNPDQARNRDYRGPDFFYIKDGVDRSRQRQYWAVWQENGRLLDVVLELLSPTTEDEDRTTKFAIYEQTLRTPEYFLYDPFTLLLEGYRLVGGTYQPLQPNERGWLWSEEMQAWLGHWEGEFLGTHATYLRLYTLEGELILLPDEDALQRLDQERQRADQAHEVAEQATRRADQAQQVAEQATRRADLAHEVGEQASRRADLEQQVAEQATRRADLAHEVGEQASRRADLEQQRADLERQRAEAAERELTQLKAQFAQRATPPNPANGNNP